jgi:hypothetical protein
MVQHTGLDPAPPSKDGPGALALALKIPVIRDKFFSSKMLKLNIAQQH